MNDEIKVTVCKWAPGRPLMLRWRDPVSGRRRAKSSGTTKAKEAERLAGELEKELQAGRDTAPSKITWGEFLRLHAERLADNPEGTQDAYRYALGHVTRVLNPDRLARLTTATLTAFVAKLRKEAMKPSTIARHLRHVKAALRWAGEQGYLAAVPKIPMPKTPGKMKGRPISGEEFDRLLLATPKVRKHDAPNWQRLLTGLWLSGLRLGEAVALSWDDGPFQIDLSGRHPAFRIQGDAQKSGRAEICPATPDFAEWLLAETPEGERSGKVFPLPSGRSQTGQTVTAIGLRAGVVVDPETGKTASAHDLRRSFGTRWAKRVMPAVLQRLMRHASVQTTMAYYVALDADDVAAGLWADYGPNGNKSGNIGPKSRVSRSASNRRKSLRGK